jgi:hypothetical protein
MYNILSIGRASVFVMPCFVLFCFVSWDLPNHPASCRALGIYRKLLMSTGASRLFGATVWKLLIIEPFSQWKLNKNQNWKQHWNLGAFLDLHQRVRFNRVYFRIFRAKVWKLLTFEWILSLEIQTNCNKWVWKEKSVELCTLPHLEISNSENWRIHTWANRILFNMMSLWNIWHHIFKLVRGLQYPVKHH